MARTGNRNTAPDAQISNRVLNGTEITGDIRSGEGDFRIDGVIRGTVELKGKLVVGEKALVEGDVLCAHANIAGKVKGRVVVSELFDPRGQQQGRGRHPDEPFGRGAGS